MLAAVWLLIAARQLVFLWPGLVPPICYVPHASPQLILYDATPMDVVDDLIRCSPALRGMGWSRQVGVFRADKVGLSWVSWVGWGREDRSASSASGIGHTHSNIKLENAR